MIKKIITACFIFSSGYSIAQGCSDAGFCTLGNLNPLHQKTGKQKLTIGITNGIGDEGVYVLTPSLKYDYKINSAWEIQAKLTSNYSSGNLGSAFGLGDLFINAQHTFNAASKWKTSLLIGTKLPLNNANLMVNGKSLPMQYQSSLGTVDAIAGLSITNNKWLFAAALQQPLTGYNNNNFLPIYFGSTQASKYPPSNNLNRKADVLLRANYEIVARKSSKVNVGVLSIYHVANDTYVNGNFSNNPIAINGSEGLTLNLTASATFAISKKINLGFLAGSPLVVREVRPDGLTRSFSITTDLIFNF